MKISHRFETGFCGLADMPAEFQKLMKCTKIELKNKFCFLDDALIAKGSDEVYLERVRSETFRSQYSSQ